MPLDIAFLNGIGDGALIADGTNTFRGNVSGTVGQILASDVSPTLVFQSELQGLSATTPVFIQANGNITSQTTLGAITFATVSPSGGGGNITFIADFDNNGIGSYAGASTALIASGRRFSIAGYDITTSSINTSTFIFLGFSIIDGGAISLNSSSNIVTNFLDSQSAADGITNSGNGGEITVNSSGSVSIGSLFSSSFNSTGIAGRGGAITVNSSSSVSIGSLFSYSLSSFSGTSGNGGDVNIIAVNSIDVGGINSISNANTKYGDIVLTANEINLTGGINSVKGTGKNIILQPSNPNQAIQVGGADSGSTSILDLTDTDLAALASGFNNITIGRSDSSGAITINAGSFTSPVTFRTPNGQININSSLSGNLNFIANGLNISNGKSLTLGKSDEIVNTANLALNGGTFNLNGFNETANQLTFSNNSAIDFGNGNSTLSFSSSSNQTWTGLLNINNWSSSSGETLKFGTNANALTPSQLSQIRFTGFNQGAQISNSGVVTPVTGSAWKVGGVKDFGGDRKADILWRNPSTSQNAIWQMSNSTLTTGNFLPNLDANWNVGGLGDFGGDGKNDILWRNNDGTNAIWQLNGSTLIGGDFLPTLAPSWTVGGVADFGGDGKADVFWRNSDGTNAIWQLNGSTLIGGDFLPTLSTDWKVGGVADFGGDGKADIFWRNSITGQNAIWQLDGKIPISLISGDFLPSLSTDWIVGGVGDFGGDGKADIFWRNSVTGQNAIWQMNGALLIASDFIPSLSTDWTSGGVGDFGGDRKSDIFWRNSSTGQNAIWELNGSTLLATNFTTSLF